MRAVPARTVSVRAVPGGGHRAGSDRTVSGRTDPDDPGSGDAPMWAGAARDDAVRTVRFGGGPTIRGATLGRVNSEALVPLPEQVQRSVGLLQYLDLPVQGSHPQRRHLIGAAGGPGLRGLPARAHHAGLLQPPQRAVHRAGVPVDRVKHP